MNEIMTAAEFDERLLAANARIAAENAQMREETRALQALVQRKRSHLARLKETLTELRAEREIINVKSIPPPCDTIGA